MEVAQLAERPTGKPRRNTDAGSSPWCGDGVFTQSQLPVQTLLLVQELCESRGGRPGLSVLTSLMVSVDVKNY